jgi:hypothetical protein
MDGRLQYMDSETIRALDNVRLMTIYGQRHNTITDHVR